MPNRSERVELARRLHDGLAQELIAVGYSLDAMIGQEDLQPRVRSQLREIRLKMMELSQNFRDEIYSLRELTFAELELQIRQLAPGRIIEISLPKELLPSEVEDCLARAILEMVRNSARHSTGDRIEVSTELSPSKIEIKVFDNGNGKISMKERSFGLASIEELLSKAGADFALESDGGGSCYLIGLPRI